MARFQLFAAEEGFLWPVLLSFSLHCQIILRGPTSVPRLTAYYINFVAARAFKFWTGFEAFGR